MKNKFYLIGLIVLIISLIFDKQIITFITNNRINSLNSFFILLEFINGYVILAFTLIILLIKKQRKLILPLIISFIFYAIIIYLLKLGIARPRPFEVLTVTSLIVKSSYSFPSGHIAAIFTALPFLEKFKDIRYIIIVLAIILMFSRLYLGVHYLSDVIAGAIIGYFIGSFVLKYKERIFKNR